MATRRALWLTALLLALLALGCAHKGGKGDDDIVDDDGDDSGDDAGSPCDYAQHDPLIVQGKAALGDSDIEGGYAAFAQALALCPDSVDARMGLALACQLQLERSMYAMIQYVVEVVPNFGWNQDAKSFGSVLQSILLDHLYPKAQEMLAHAQAVRGAPAGWGFDIAKYPFLVDGEFPDRVIVDMGGRWDVSDARIVEAEAQAYMAFVTTIGAYDLSFAWSWTQNVPDTSGMTLPEKVHALTGWALGWIGDPTYPDFLLVRGDLGTKYLNDAGLAWGAALTGIPEAFDMIRAETTDQSRDVSAYVDENGNGRWDPGEPYRLPYIGTLNPGQEFTFEGLLALSRTIGQSAWDTGPSDVDPDNPNVIRLSDFQFLLDALGFDLTLPVGAGVSIGHRFNDPQPDQLKSDLLLLLQTLNTYTAPKALADQVQP